MPFPRNSGRFVFCCVASFWIAILGSLNVVAQVEEADDLFLFKPDSPSRLVRGAVIAESLDRPDMAQGYINELISQQPTTELLIELRNEFGIGTFLQLSGTQSLQPASGELLALINEASLQVSPSASTVRSLIQKLGGQKTESKDAILRILSAGREAAVPLLDADTDSIHGKIADQILRRHARRFRIGLLDALTDADASRTIRILNLLAFSRDEELALDLVPYLFHSDTQVVTAARTAIRRITDDGINPATESEAAELLLTEAMSLLTGIDSRYPSREALFRDSQLQSRLTDDQQMIPGVATVARASSLLVHANSLEPGSVRCDAATMVATAAQDSWPSRWPDVDAIAIGSEAVSETSTVAERQAFSMAVAADSPSAMLGLLNNAVTATSVFNDDPGLRRRYLLSSDCRVRLLAASIAHLLGDDSHRVQRIIEASANGPIGHEAVVIDSRRGEVLSSKAVIGMSRLSAAADNVRIETGALANLDSLSTKLGVTSEELQDIRSDKNHVLHRRYEAVAADSGQRGFLEAVDQMQCELVLMHSNCLRWGPSGTVANLRADFRTRDVPVIIYGPPVDKVRTAIVQEQHDGVWFFPGPLSVLTIHDQLRINEIPSPLLTLDEREQMSTFARAIQR